MSAPGHTLLAKDSALRDPDLPLAAGLPHTGARACASTHGDPPLPPPEAGAYVSPLVRDGTLVSPPSPEGGDFLGASRLSLAGTSHVPAGTGADAGTGAVAGDPDHLMPAAPGW